LLTGNFDFRPYDRFIHAVRRLFVVNPMATPVDREPLSESRDTGAFSREEQGTVAVVVQDQVDAHKSKEAAQDAFRRGDVEASRVEHAKRSAEKHNTTASEYVKSIVFGGLDGIMTTFAVVTAAAGANESWKLVLVFGFANAFADAFSMGFGEYISGSAELDQAKRERAREEWEVEHNIDGEIEEMVEIYEQKGFPSDDAKLLVSIISKDPKRFVDIMMVEELGIFVDADETWTGPLKQGAVMFTAFVMFGFFPLFAYFGGKGQGLDWVFGLSCGITGLGLLILGGAKGFLTGMSIPITSVKMLISGVISGGVSFGVGVLMSYIVTGEASLGGGG
jgi:VIT1/CCC1 family predicted Fe2+/Mn2+ transporter